MSGDKTNCKIAQLLLNDVGSTLTLKVKLSDTVTSVLANICWQTFVTFVEYVVCRAKSDPFQFVLSQVRMNCTAYEPEDRALPLCASEKYSRARKLFEHCATIGVLRANAELSWLLLHGRKGLYHLPTFFEQIQAFQCAAATSCLGCVHCSGVLSYCLMKGVACRPNRKRAAELARSSCEAGIKFGQFVMGELHRLGLGGCVRSTARALQYLHLAALQGLDAAQCSLGDM
jgi:hypothetical protein